MFLSKREFPFWLPALFRRSLRLRLHSVQFPFQPLQGCVNFIGSNGRLTLIAVAGVHEYGDVLHPFLHEGEVLS
jgi:hypothetical protein